jgi:hypothetical protein
MNRSTGAPVSLVVQGERGTLRLSFYTPDDPQTPRVETWADLDEGERKALWQNLRRRLEDFRDRLGEDAQVDDWGALSAAVHDLHRLGQWLASKLFGPRNIRAVTRLFEEAYPEWDNPEADPALIEVRAPSNHTVPIEFMPVFGVKDLATDEIKDVRRLTEVARFFPGFSTIVKRQIASGRKLPQASALLDNAKRLPVKLFYHAGFPGARDELRFFRENDHCFALKGHWPRSSCDAPFCRSEGCASRDSAEDVLPGHLWDPRLGFRCSEPVGPDQILHFACHCHYLDDADPETLCLTFSHDGKDRQVTVETLREKLANCGGGQQENLSLPLVFVNACGTAATPSGLLPALPYFFLVENGNRGFIGTEALIPDAVAAAFSRRFYYHLLRGQTLGMAFYAAKQDLLKRHRNPMGILYTAYANPDLRVSQPVKNRIRV